MNKQPILDIKLVSIGQIVSKLHYRVNSREWWIMRSDSSDLENGTLLYPIRNEISEILPGYRCHSGSKFSDIETALSYAITSLYQQLFSNSKIKFSRPLVLGWDDNELLKASLKDLYFQAFAIKIDSKILMYITNIGVGKQKNTIESYIASFIKVWKNEGFTENIVIHKLFGLEYPMMQKTINAQQIPTCSPTFWNNEILMDNIFNYHLRKRTLSNIN
ncbi:3967_t:CDS:2 [Funneliformis mosseae]|uniref:3967_t:CDS:1 n=1 Tax=Funneliformis mosseae TaxID=27381 RepID=A0A9N8WAA2_FUNMO|nr:3967_t:CDS:2 [Funneliformis mosseae]